MTKKETTELVTDIYKIFYDKESNMMAAYVATMSIASSIAQSIGITQEEFLRDCKDSFADGETVGKVTIN